MSKNKNNSNKPNIIQQSMIINQIAFFFLKYSQKINQRFCAFIKNCTFGEQNGKQQIYISFFDNNLKQGCFICYIYCYNNYNYYPLGVYILHIILFFYFFQLEERFWIY